MSFHFDWISCWILFILLYTVFDFNFALLYKKFDFNSHVFFWVSLLLLSCFWVSFLMDILSPQLLNPAWSPLILLALSSLLLHINLLVLLFLLSIYLFSFAISLTCFIFIISLFKRSALLKEIYPLSWVIFCLIVFKKNNIFKAIITICMISVHVNAISNSICF